MALNGTTPITGMGYRYTPSGGSVQARLQSVTGGLGDAIRFGYANNASLLESVNYETNGSPWIGRSMQYDFLNRLKQINTGYGDQHNYEFDALNRRKKDTLGDGSRWEYAYDQLGQLTNAVKFDVGSVTNLNRPIPTGLRPPAQGCSANAGLPWVAVRNKFNRNAVVALDAQ